MDMESGLLDAIRNQDVERIKSIASSVPSAKLHVTDSEGRTPLLIAAAEGKLDSLKTLIDCGGDPSAVDLGGRNAFLIACAEGHLALAHFLLGINPKFAESRTKAGNTGLHRAAAYGQPDVAVMLIQRGVELQAKNAEGQTALHRACRWGHEDCVNVLLEAGADPLCRDPSGKTPLDWALDKGHDDVVASVESHMRTKGIVETAGYGAETVVEEAAFPAQTYIDATADTVPEVDGQELYELGTPMHVEGWMAKQGHFFKNWKNRWFVLDGRTVSYYAKEGAKVPKGVINMVEGTDVIIEEKYPKPFCFTIITPSKKFIVQAADEDEMAEWIEAIQNNLDCCAPNTDATTIDDDD